MFIQNKIDLSILTYFRTPYSIEIVGNLELSLKNKSTQDAIKILIPWVMDFVLIIGFIN